MKVDRVGHEGKFESSIQTSPFGRKCSAPLCCAALVLGLVPRIPEHRGDLPNLTTQATRITAAKEWRWYDWESRSKVLVGRLNGDRLGLYEMGLTGRERQATYAWESVRSGKIASIDGLSPNKKWLHCIGYMAPTPVHEFVSLAGSRTLYPRDTMEQGAFSPDSRDWFYVHTDGGGILRFGELGVSQHRKMHEELVTLQSHHALPKITSVLGHRHVIVTEVGGAKQLVLEEVDLESKKLVHTYSFQCPLGGALSDSTLSPSGTSVAFLQLSESQSVPGGAQSLNGSPTEPVIRQSLWVGQLNGNHTLRCLGVIDVPNSSQFSESDTLAQIRWLPDGKRLSFLYKRALWTVPAG